MYKKREGGFTLIELLVVVAIIGILVAVIILFVNTSRAKAQDAKIRQVLSNVRNTAEEERNEKGTYSEVCSNGKAYGVISTLAEQTNLTYEQYKCYAGDTGFVVAFPLSAEDGYWCVDSLGNGRQAGAAPTGAVPYTCPAGTGAQARSITVTNPAAGGGWPYDYLGAFPPTAISWTSTGIPSDEMIWYAYSTDVATEPKYYDVPGVGRSPGRAWYHVANTGSGWISRHPYHLSPDNKYQIVFQDEAGNTIGTSGTFTVSLY